jgi:hypothetical protein
MTPVSGNPFYRAGCASMQGFRNDMEDDHNLDLSLPGHEQVCGCGWVGWGEGDD